MDAPPIQYAKTSDGVNIAYWAIGEGPPLVIMTNLLASNLQLEWEADDRERLSAHGGSEVKAMGDGFMIWFPSATRALECAIALQRAFAPKADVGARHPAITNEETLAVDTGDDLDPTHTPHASPLGVLSQDIVDTESGPESPSG